MSYHDVVAFGSERITYTLDQLKYLEEMKKLNGGSVSKAFEIAIDENRFPWVKTPRDCCNLLYLIETCESRLKMLDV